MSEMSRFKSIVAKQTDIGKHIVIIFLFIIIFSFLLIVIGLLEQGQERRQDRITEEAVENVVGRHIASIRDEMRASREMMDSVLHIYSNFMQEHIALVRRYMEHLDEHMDHDHN